MALDPFIQQTVEKKVTQLMTEIAHMRVALEVTGNELSKRFHENKILNTRLNMLAYHSWVVTEILGELHGINVEEEFKSPARTDKWNALIDAFEKETNAKAAQLAPVARQETRTAAHEEGSTEDAGETTQPTDGDESASTDPAGNAGSGEDRLARLRNVAYGDFRDTRKTESDTQRGRVDGKGTRLGEQSHD